MLKILKKCFRLSILAFFVSLGLSAFWAIPAEGHANHVVVAHLRVQPQAIRISLALPASLVAFADDDRNGQLSSPEIASHQLQLQNFFSHRLRLSDSQGQEGKVTVDVAGKLSLPPGLLNVDSYSTVSLTYSWPRPVLKLKIDYDLLDYLPQSYFNLPQAYYLTTVFDNNASENYISTNSSPTLELDLKKGRRNLLSSGFLIAIAVAFIWGAAHALSPGHGKTLVGAYLVGSRANTKHALFLGLTTTLTHTIVVFALGIATLLASRYFLPAKFIPWISLLSGLMVVAVGFNLLENRLSFNKRKAPHLYDHSHHDHDHSHHDHDHSHHDHDHSHHDHDHSHHDHDHFPLGTDRNPVTWRSLLALGIAGGLVPCPAALVLLLSTISLGQIGFGLLLVSVFSLGLAVTLTGLGILLVNAKPFLKRLPNRLQNPTFLSIPMKTTTVLSVVSASIILLIGLGLTYQAVLQIQLPTRIAIQ